MRTPVQIRKAWEKPIIALAAFDYLTAYQLTRLLYSASSRKHVQEQLKLLVDHGLAITVGGRAVSLPLIYTLTSNGRHYAQSLGVPTGKRFRPSEEADKGHNPYFLKHTMAISDVLIGAHLLSQRVLGVVLNRIYTERELRRRTYVEIVAENISQHRTICIEPDASLDFAIQGKWRDFFHIEIYRNLPPAEWRFKQKVQGYVATVDTGRHEALFHTPALSIAVIAATEQMAATLKRWTEETLQAIGRPEEGDWFFFCSLDTATASPEEMYLAPLWQKAFSDVKTPLLVLE